MGGGTKARYWTCPTQSNTAPSNVLSTTGTNNANYWMRGRHRSNEFANDSRGVCGITRPLWNV